MKLFAVQLSEKSHMGLGKARYLYAFNHNCNFSKLFLFFLDVYVYRGGGADKITSSHDYVKLAEAIHFLTRMVYLVILASSQRIEESQNNEGNQKDKKKLRTTNRGTELIERRVWREKTVSTSADGIKQPRVTLPSNKEPTFFIGGGNGVGM